MRVMQYLADSHRFSLNFRVWEFCQSETADAHGIEIRVVEHSPVHCNLRGLCHYTLQPTREAVGSLSIYSGYRPAHVNELVGGEPDSQHTTGESADVWHATLSPLELAQAFLDAGVPFDQLILEHDQGVVHVSHVRQTPKQKSDGVDPNRGEFLTRYEDADGVLHYVAGLHPVEELTE